MDAGRTDASSPSYFAASASSTDNAAGSTGNDHAFRTLTTDCPDRCGRAGNTLARATMARSHTLFGFAWRWPGPAVIKATTRVGRATETSRAVRSANGPICDFDGPAGAAHRMPLPPPPRFPPMAQEVALPPLVIPHDQSSHGAASSAEARDDAWPGRRACSWPRSMFSAVAYRLRYWATPGERHKAALRMANSREGVSGAAYVFLNAMQSDEPLVKHFANLRRQVRRLDKCAGTAWGISDESALVLREAADRTAAAREKVRDKILSFHREELLYDLRGTDFHRADGILLVLESRMATGVALYGHALRRLAATDVAEDSFCETVGQVLETVFAREAAAGTAQPRDWLGCAVSRLPSRTLMQLHAVLSAGLVCGGAYQSLLDELALIVASKAGLQSASGGFSS